MDKNLINNYLASEQKPLTRVNITVRASHRPSWSKSFKATFVRSILTFFALITFISTAIFLGKSIIDRLQPFPIYISPRTEASSKVAGISDELPLRVANAPVEKFAESLVNSLSGEVVYAYDPDTLQVYASKNADEKVHIASITKLISVLVILEKYKLTDEITFTGEFNGLENVFGVQAGEKMKVSEALKVLLIASKNDLPEEFAVNYSDGGHDGFLRRMNSLAMELGMKNSHFDTPSGLYEEENYSTASDLRLLVARVLNRKEIMGLVGERGDVVEVIGVDGVPYERNVSTTNYLLSVIPEARGLKTGFTRSAGECLIGYFVYEDSGASDVSSDVGGEIGGSTGIAANVGGSSKRRLVTIVLGSDDRFGETIRLVR